MPDPPLSSRRVPADILIHGAGVSSGIALPGRDGSLLPLTDSFYS
jgi:hypothetical protein